MININDKHNCCGCEACVQRCPKSCITMQEDAEGFLYPVVDKTSCVECLLCERVCPMLMQKKDNLEITEDGNNEKEYRVFAAFNPDDETRLNSSSGGIFTLLAEKILSEGGVVFGARFDSNWQVILDYTESSEGLAAFRGSKYIQARVDNAYKNCEQFLKFGRKVLFSGTPCQIAGLKFFLRKNYDNLLSVECVCHSVPSPGIWRQYLDAFLQQKKRKLSEITDINFRNKVSGWINYSVVINFTEDGQYVSSRTEDLWMKGFINGLYTRLSCARCPVKSESSMADITLGDLWGVTSLLPEETDDKGINVVLSHTEKGEAILNASGIDPVKHFTLADVANYNPAIVRSAIEKGARVKFYNRLQKRQDIFIVIRELTKYSLAYRVRILLSKIKNIIIPYK